MEIVDEKGLLNKIHKRRESAHLEFKSSKSWNCTNMRARLIKAILAMSNMRDGGTIVIGVKELKSSKKFELTCMKNENQINTYVEEYMKAMVREFADPIADFEVNTLPDPKLDPGGQKKYVVIRVFPFQRFPVICKKTWKKYSLQKGKIYARRNDPPQSTEVSDYYMMREILDLAIERNLRFTPQPIINKARKQRIKKRSTRK